MDQPQTALLVGKTFAAEDFKIVVGDDGSFQITFRPMKPLGHCQFEQGTVDVTSPIYPADQRHQLERLALQVSHWGNDLPEDDKFRTSVGSFTVTYLHLKDGECGVRLTRGQAQLIGMIMGEAVGEIVMRLTAPVLDL